jgi:hypothetical protein
MTDRDLPGADRRFGPTSGLFPGVLGLALVAVVVVLTLVANRSVGGVRVALAALAVGVLIYAYLVRPRVVLGPRTVLLRNAFIDYVIPYAAIQDVSVRTVTRVYVGERTYAGIGVGHPARKLLREQGQRRPDSPPAQTSLRGQVLHDAIPDFVAAQVLEKATLSTEGGEAGPVRRKLAVPELVALGVLVVAFLVSLLF